VGKRGRAYLVEFVDGNKRKELIANPIHLIPVKEAGSDHA
jgi:ribosomal protein L21E